MQERPNSVITSTTQLTPHTANNSGLFSMIWAWGINRSPLWLQPYIQQGSVFHRLFFGEQQQRPTAQNEINAESLDIDNGAAAIDHNSSLQNANIHNAVNIAQGVRISGQDSTGIRSR